MGGSRTPPLSGPLKQTSRQALSALRGDIEGARPLATAGTQAFLGLLGAGEGPYSALSAIGPLGELISSGSPVDLSDAFSAATSLARRNIEDQGAAIQSQFGPLGLRFSTDALRGQERFRERATQDLNAFILQQVAAAQEAARLRQLQAFGLSADLFSGARQSALAPIFAGANLATQIPVTPPSFGQQLAGQVIPAAATIAGAYFGGPLGASAGSALGSSLNNVAGLATPPYSNLPFGRPVTGLNFGGF